MLKAYKIVKKDGEGRLLSPHGGSFTLWGKVNDTFPGPWIITEDPLLPRDSGLHLTTNPHIWKIKGGYLLEVEYREPFVQKDDIITCKECRVLRIVKKFK